MFTQALLHFLFTRYGRPKKLPRSARSSWRTTSVLQSAYFSVAISRHALVFLVCPALNRFGQQITASVIQLLDCINVGPTP